MIQEGCEHCHTVINYIIWGNARLTCIATCPKALHVRFYQQNHNSARIRNQQSLISSPTIHSQVSLLKVRAANFTFFTQWNHIVYRIFHRIKHSIVMYADPVSLKTSNISREILNFKWDQSIFLKHLKLSSCILVCHVSIIILLLYCYFTVFI